MRSILTALCVLLSITSVSYSQVGWYAVDDPFPNLNWIGIDFLNNNFGFVVGEQGRIKRTTNGGEDWEFRTSNVHVTLNAVTIADENVAYAAGFDGTLVKTTDGGDTWTTITIPDVSNTLLGVYFSDAYNGFVCGAKEILFRTTDGGATWEEQDPRFGNNNVWDIAYLGEDSIFVACGNAAHISRSTNHGTKWKSQSVPFEYEIYSIDFADTSVGYAVGESATILGTKNGGVDWAVIDPGFPVPAYPFKSVSVPDPYHTYLCGWNGMVIGTQDGGNTWEVQDLPTEYTGTHLTGISFPSARTGYMIGWDGAIFKTVNGGTLDIERIHTVAGSFALEATYPNPTVAGAPLHVRFSVPASSPVTLTVYDVLGHQVQRITETATTAGTFQTALQTTVIAPGAYLLHLRTAFGNCSARVYIR